MMNSSKNIPDDNTVLSLADLFAALGDPSRIKILAVLMDGEINVSSPDLLRLWERHPDKLAQLPILWRFHFQRVGCVDDR